MTGEPLETVGHKDNALFPLRWRWNGHQGWFPLDFLFFGAVWRTSRRNFQNFRKVPESIKMKQTKNGKFPYHYFLVTEIQPMWINEEGVRYLETV